VVDLELVSGRLEEAAHERRIHMAPPRFMPGSQS